MERLTVVDIQTEHYAKMSRFLNNPEKFLYVGGAMAGKREFSNEFTSKKYYIQKRLPAFGPCYDYLPVTTRLPKVEIYNRRTLTLIDKHGEKIFYFMVNNPYMTDAEIMEKLVNGHRGVRRR